MSLRSIVAANRAAGRGGITSWCTAQPDTLRAILRAHAAGDDPVLIEATCNQVNHRGGYTGMTPQRFRGFAEGLAREAGVDQRRLILGGDHLGPNPWKHLPAAQALAEAEAMVSAYVAAGFSKIHLDASMACADDAALSEPEMAERAASLCAVAEQAGGGGLSYVIGTDVPVPGGETAALDALAITRPDAALRTHALHREAFERRGLGQAFARVIGIVVQPGVDFGNAQVFAYDPSRAQDLIAALARIPGAVFEAHSTDYQAGAALAALVGGHFAILKVGPELTFAFREAVMAMAAIESWLAPREPSNLLGAIAAAMDADPQHWRSYIAPGPDAALMKLFGLSDRLRYYWPAPAIAAALRQLRHTIDTTRIAPGLLAQCAGPLEPGPLPLSDRIIQSRVGAVVKKYREACGLKHGWRLEREPG